MFIESGPNSLHCPLSKYWIHVFKNALINCSLLLVLAHCDSYLPDNMPLWPTDNGTMRIKKSGNECDLWVPLKTVSVYNIPVSEHILQCVCVCVCTVHQPPPPPPPITGAERLDLLTVMTRWQVTAEFIFPLFYCKYSSGLQRTYAARTRKVKTQAGTWEKKKTGGEDEACKCSAPSNSHDAAPQSNWEFLANAGLLALMIGFQLIGHSQQLCEVD